VEPSLLQALFLRNDQDVLRMIDRPEGWIRQVSAELGRSDRDNRRDVAENRESDRRRDRDISPERQRQMRRQAAALEDRAAKLVKDGDKEQAERVRRRALRLRQEVRRALDGTAARESPPKRDARPNDAAGDKDRTQAKVADGAKAAGKKPDVKAMIRSAYLRTLSRPPTANEEERIRAHLAATDDRVTGLRDLIWVLVNSKEFIINH
jgi:hypothetical protein